MKRTILLLLLSVLFSIGSKAQEDRDPYRLRVGVDLPITVGMAGASYFGVKYLRNKPSIDSAFVANADPSDINKFDRGATRNHSMAAYHASDMALYTSFLLPITLLANKQIRSDALKIGALYLETMAIMANVYTWGVGSTRRPRPYVYNHNVDWSERTGRGALNSFFSGHPASAAAATFFAAKVYNDYHPESKCKYLIYGLALIPPSAVGYFRYKDGQHFPSDILVGIPLGAAIGILIPQLHKKSNKSNLSITPVTGPYKGLVLDYRF